MIKNVTMFPVAIACYFEEAPLMTEVGTAIGTGICTVETITGEGSNRYSYMTDSTVYLIVDALGASQVIPYEDVTFDTDAGGLIIC